jgi:hypothetical protein
MTQRLIVSFHSIFYILELWCHRPRSYKPNRQDNKKEEKALATYQPPSPQNIDNTPAWMSHQDQQQEQSATDANEEIEVVGSWSNTNFEDLNKYASGYAKLVKALSAQLHICEMPLQTDSNLPAMSMRLGSCDKGEVQVRFNLDTCVGMTTGNERLHQYIITNYPKIVHSYEEYNRSNPFSPISLEGVTSNGDNLDFETGKLTAVVTYYTRYKHNGKAVTISFGLGEGVCSII